MITLNFNIGYETHGNSGILNRYPLSYSFNTVKDSFIFIRRNVLELSTWAIHNNVPKSALKLHILLVDNEWQWDWTVSLNNVREYKELLKFSNEDLTQMLSEKERDDKIENILN